jgi:hypothetical protein
MLIHAVRARQAGLQKMTSSRGFEPVLNMLAGLLMAPMIKLSSGFKFTRAKHERSLSQAEHGRMRGRENAGPSRRCRRRGSNTDRAHVSYDSGDSSLTAQF